MTEDISDYLIKPYKLQSVSGDIFSLDKSEFSKFKLLYFKFKEIKKIHETPLNNKEIKFILAFIKSGVSVRINFTDINMISIVDKYYLFNGDVTVFNELENMELGEQINMIVSIIDKMNDYNYSNFVECMSLFLAIIICNQRGNKLIAILSEIEKKKRSSDSC